MTNAFRIAVAVFAVLLIATPLHAQSAALGTWQVTTLSPEGETKSTLVISEDGGKLKAVAKGERGERAYDSIQVDGNKITLVLTISYNGSPMTITYTGTVDAKKMGGDADFGGLAMGTWSAVAQ